MKKLFLGLLCFVFFSCNFIDKKVPEKEELLNERLQEINWNEVTLYPSVSECDSITDKALAKSCFFDYLTHSVQERLSTDTLSVLYPEIDTIYLKVTVNADSSVYFESQLNDKLDHKTQRIDSLIKVRLQNFPEINPGQKEGIPVKTEFILPVILKVE